MKKVSAGIAIAVVVFLLIAGSAYVWSARGSTEQTASTRETAVPVSFDAVKSEKEATAQRSGLFTGALLAGSAAPLLDFVKSDYEQAAASDKLVVLYFYANWCPICKVEVANSLFPAFNELTDERVVGFRVNYNDSDTDADEKALAREFGVGYQHTKVFVRNGQRILKSPEVWDKQRYLDEIQRAL